MVRVNDTVHDTRAWPRQGDTSKCCQGRNAGATGRLQAGGAGTGTRQRPAQLIGWASRSRGGRRIPVGIVAGIAMLAHKSDLDEVCVPSAGAQGIRVEAFRLTAPCRRWATV